MRRGGRTTLEQTGGNTRVPPPTYATWRLSKGEHFQKKNLGEKGKQGWQDRMASKRSRTLVGGVAKYSLAAVHLNVRKPGAYEEGQVKKGGSLPTT